MTDELVIDIEKTPSTDQEYTCTFHKRESEVVVIVKDLKSIVLPTTPK